ncbi:MAG: hypothetical protein M3437_19275 [Chloroflexota bacterium]|nr:hypothetical protein [Chloroflexota bacterium]
MAVVAALCLGCNAAADDVTLTVGQCIGDNATNGPVEEALIKEDLIEENLLQTKVTKVVCEDMLKPISGSTRLQKLAAAQRYIQEIKLIEGAMRDAAAEEAARATDWHSSSNESMQFGAIAQTSELVAAQDQYDDAIGGIEPRELQAAAAARVGENNVASIATRLRQKEVTAANAGATVPEARAGARCSTEIEVSDDEVRKIVAGRYEILPQMPKKIPLGETAPAGLLVSPIPQRRSREISQKHDAIKEASKTNFGCGFLTDRMQAELVPLQLGALGAEQLHHNDIQKLSSYKEIKWSWNVSGRQAGNPEVSLVLSYELSQEGQQFRGIPQVSPVYEEPIRVTAQPWWQRIWQLIFGS